MIKILFDQYGLYVGQDREQLNTESEIYLSEFPSGLMKTTTEYENIPRVDGRGNQLYLLSTEGGYVDSMMRVESIEDTDDPVYEVVHERHPMIGEDGEQQFIISNGPSGDKEYLWVNEVIHIHKENNKGEPLYWKDEVVSHYDFDKVETREINSSDKEWHDLLPLSYDQQPYSVSYSFQDNPFLFTFEDVREYKRDMLLKGTFGIEAFLLEEFIPEYFESYRNVDTSRSFVVINPEGFMKTIDIKFRQKSNYFKLIPEVSGKGLSFIGHFRNSNGLVYDIKFSSILEVVTNELFDTVSFSVTNSTSKQIVVDSIGLIS